ncbi:Crustacean CHH/MIH/GIH neurohormone family [Popillia japonica]|uniref:Crustacean CHH/MIH/GIH neurohormone family n=1 Tax=Popillia japonica TaxID=7064 RepID=A0AAW1K4L3_POPJA
MNHRSTSASTQLVWVCMALTLVIQVALSSPLQKSHPLGHHLMKRQSAFFRLECRGNYNKSKFARLDRVCEDCYNLFREPEVHTMCRKKCFTSYMFKGCVDALHKKMTK